MLDFHLHWPSFNWYAAGGLLLLLISSGCSEPNVGAATDDGAPVLGTVIEPPDNGDLQRSTDLSDDENDGQESVATDNENVETTSLDLAVQDAPPIAEPASESASADSKLANQEDSSADGSSESEALEELLAEVVVPPPWLTNVQTAYDTSKPWKEARLEIRRLLGVGAPETHREALKLTWIYYQTDNMGDGHEYPMYTFLGGEPLWSVLAHREFLAKPHENTPIHAYISLASLYAQYGEFEKAKATLEVAMDGLPVPPWKTMRHADLLVAMGDLYVDWGRTDNAKSCYLQAAELYPTAKPPYGGHLLPRRAAESRAKLDRLTLQSLSSATLRDGEYRDNSLGYAGDIRLTVVIEGGRIADIKLRHEEKIDQNACVLIPKWIVEQQSLQVDGISGATVTRDAIVNGTYRCLQKAGLK